MYANLLGNEAGRAIYDGDALIATGGKLVAAGPRFSFADHTLITATVDVDLTRSRHGWLSSFRPHVDVGPRRVRQRAAHAFPELAAGARSAASPTAGKRRRRSRRRSSPARCRWRCSTTCARAGSQGFVVSLSGGADSGAVACLVSLAVRFAEQEIGLAHCASGSAMCAGIDGLRERDGPGRPTRSPRSTRPRGTARQTTRAAARGVAEAVGRAPPGARRRRAGGGLRGLASRALGRELTWAEDDIALQNIQARARAPSVWLLANLDGRALALHQQPLRGRGGLRDHGRRHRRRALSPSPASTKPSSGVGSCWLETVGPEGSGPSRLSLRQRAAAHGGAAARVARRRPTKPT